MTRKRVLPAAGLALALLAPAAASACPQHTPSEELAQREGALAELVGAPLPATGTVEALPSFGAVAPVSESGR